MKKGIIAAICVVLALLVLVACAPQAAPPAAVPQVPAPPEIAAPSPAKVIAPAGPVKPAWEVEWERVVEAAKKEDKLVAYSSWGGQVRGPFIQAFREKYGIPIEIITGRGGEVSQKLLSERRAGIFSVDVYLAGLTTTITVLKPAGILDPLDSAFILPEATDTKAWLDGRLPWVDQAHTILAYFAYVQPAIGVNTNLVKPEELKSYRDLLNPKWKGKIIFNDPTVEGAGNEGFGTISKIMGYDFLRELAKQQPVVMRDQRLMLDWLAHGKASIVVPPKTDIFIEFMRVGAPVRIVIPSEGGWYTAGSGGLSLVNRAPHPNVAKVLINWLLTKEGQTVAAKAAGCQSARLDVPTDFLPALIVRDPAQKYFNGSAEEFLLERPKIKDMAVEIFGPLMK